ncbi:MAG: carboxypeptidase-like regulatory domain-containing protein, partial [bacterium]
MRKKVPFRFFTILTFLALPGLLFAQRGTISGKVVDSKSGDPLPGASVLVEGLELGAATNIDGEYTIENVPAGARKVIARFIGYKTSKHTVNVTGGSTRELNFELDETVLQLDEVVVTGAGVASEKKRLGNTVATINTSQIEEAPITSLSEMLAARQPGVSVLPSGGLLGEGARIRIRGNATLSTSNEPIVYVDGVRIDGFGGFAGDVYVGGGGVPSRLDDINPDAIERVEILKGAAAATLYGTQASNGIIQIFTKKGSFGKPRFSVEIEQSTLNYPDRIPDNAGFARDAEQAANMSRVFGRTIQPFELYQQNFARELFGTGYGQSYSLSVSGGGSGITYFVNGRFQDTNGPIAFSPDAFAGNSVGGADDELRRGQFSANLNIVPSSNLNIRISTLYSNVKQQTIENNNNIYAPVSAAMFAKSEFADDNNLKGNQAFMTVREGTFEEVADETDHVTVSLSANYRIIEGLTLDATAGLDFVSQRSTEFRPFGWNVDDFVQLDPQGFLQLGKREHKEWTVDVKANWTRNVTKDISSTFLAGFQGFNTVNTISDAEVDIFPGPGLEVLDAAQNQQTVSRFSEVINAGFFVQEQVGYKDYLFVTGGLRFDANSAFGT